MGIKHSTLVANAYPCDIWVKCDAEKSYVSSANYSTDAKLDGSTKTEKMQVNASGGINHSRNIQYDWHKIQTNFCRIGHNEFLRFDVPFSKGASNKIVYITVIGDDGRPIVDGLQRFSDRSIIVTRDGYIRDTKYGAVWQEANGAYHKNP